MFLKINKEINLMFLKHTSTIDYNHATMNPLLHGFEIQYIVYN